MSKFLRERRVLRFFLYRPTQIFLLHYTYKLGILIHQEAEIGQGFYIGHPGSIFVNGAVTIGANCNISHEVTLGSLSRGPTAGAPQIGNNVYIGPGAKLIGKVKVGNNAVVGANSLIVTDVPENAVMMGVPAKVFSKTGSSDYVNHTDYPYDGALELD